MPGLPSANSAHRTVRHPKCRETRGIGARPFRPKAGEHPANDVERFRSRVSRHETKIIPAMPSTWRGGHASAKCAPAFGAGAAPKRLVLRALTAFNHDALGPASTKRNGLREGILAEVPRKVSANMIGQHLAQLVGSLSCGVSVQVDYISNEQAQYSR